MSVCSPVAIAGQACAWTSVGASKADSNHSRTGGVKCDNGTSSRLAAPSKRPYPAGYVAGLGKIEVRRALTQRHPAHEPPSARRPRGAHRVRRGRAGRGRRGATAVAQHRRPQGGRGPGDAERAARALGARALARRRGRRLDRSHQRRRADGRAHGRIPDRAATRRRPRASRCEYVRVHPEVFGIDAPDLADLRLTRRYESAGGVTHLAWTQTYAGVASYDNVLLANVDGDGRLLNVGGSAVSGLRVGSVVPDLAASAALAAARRETGGALIAPRARRGRGPERPTSFAGGDRARLALFNDGATTRLAWVVQVTGRARLGLRGRRRREQRRDAQALLGHGVRRQRECLRQLPRGTAGRHRGDARPDGAARGPVAERGADGAQRQQRPRLRRHRRDERLHAAAGRLGRRGHAESGPELRVPADALRDGAAMSRLGLHVELEHARDAGDEPQAGDDAALLLRQRLPRPPRRRRRSASRRVAATSRGPTRSSPSPTTTTTPTARRRRRASTTRT